MSLIPVPVQVIHTSEAHTSGVFMDTYTTTNTCNPVRITNLVKIMKYVECLANVYWHGCVRGQHGRGQGQGQGSSRPRPRPAVFEAKATKVCPRDALEVDASPRGPPYLGFFLPRELRRERLCQVVCLSITLKFNALLPPLVRLCMNYEVLYLWY